MLSKTMRQLRSFKRLTQQSIPAWKCNKQASSYWKVNRCDLTAQLHFSNKSYFSTLVSGDNNVNVRDNISLEVKELASKMILLAKSQEGMSMSEQENLLDSIKGLGQNLNSAEKIRLLHAMNRVNYRGQQFQRLWLSLLNDFENSLTQHLINIVSFGCDNKLWKSNRQTLFRIINKIHKIIENQEKIVLMSNEQYQNIDCLAQNSSKIIHNVVDNTFFFYIKKMLLQNQLISHQKIAKLIGYVFSYEENARKLKNLDIGIITGLVGSFASLNFKTTLLDKKIIDALRSYRSLESNNTFQLIGLLNFVSNLIRDQQEQQNSIPKNEQSPKSTEIQFQIKRNKQYLVAVAHRLVKRYKYYVELSQQGKNKLQFQKTTAFKQKFSLIFRDHAAIKIVSQVLSYLSKHQIFEEKIWINLLEFANKVNLSYQKGARSKLIIVFKSLCQLNQQVIPGHYYQMIIQKYKILLSKKLARFYLTLQHQSQKDFTLEMTQKIFKQNIQPILAQLEAGETKSKEKDNHQENQDKTERQKQNESINLTQKNKNQSQSEFKKSQKQQKYVQILKSELDLMKQELEFYRSIKQKILDFQIQKHQFSDNVSVPEVHNILSGSQNINQQILRYYSEQQDKSSQVEKSSSQEQPARKVATWKKKTVQKQQKKVTKKPRQQGKVRQSKSRSRQQESQIETEELKMQEQQLDIEMMKFELEKSQKYHEQSMHLAVDLSKFEAEKKQQWLQSASSKNQKYGQKKGSSSA